MSVQSTPGGNLYFTTAAELADPISDEQRAINRDARDREVKEVAYEALYTTTRTQNIVHDALAVNREAEHLVSQYEALSDNVDSRVQHIETIAGLAPGEVTDAQTANLIRQPDSSTRDAFGDTLAAELNDENAAGRAAVDQRIRELAPPPFVISDNENTPVRDGQVLFVVGKPEFNPLELRLAWWFDASTLNRSNGTSVTQWDDLSGYARHATQGDAPAAPTYLAEGFNGRPALDFDGTAYLSTPEFDPITEPLTLFLVGQTDQPEAGQTFVDGIDSTGRTFLGTTSGRWMISRASSFTGGTADTDPHIFTVVLWEGDFRLRVDGEQIVSQAFTIANRAPIGTHIGARHSTLSNLLDGRIAEMFMAVGELSDDEIERAEAYLAQKVGL